MKAPVSAYAIIDNKFVTEVKRKDGKNLVHYVAKFLRGSESEGGYAVTDSELPTAVKRIFHLDHLLRIRRKDPGTGEEKIVGFIGGVNVGGANEKYHNLTKRFGGMKNKSGTIKYLNDAGLNVRPTVTVEMVSTWANWVMVRFVFAGSFYNPVDSGTYSSELPGLSGTQGYVAPRKSATFTKTFVHPSPVPPSQGTAPSPDGSGYQEDYSYNVSAEAKSNDEGSIGVITNSFVSGPRVLYPRRGFMFSADEPTTILDMTGDVRYDMTEADYIKMFGLAEGLVSSAKVYLYQSPGGSNPPTLDTPLPQGWYHDTVFDGSDNTKAFFVNASGLVEKVKLLQELPDPKVVVYVRFCSDRNSNPAYPRYAIEFELLGGGYGFWGNRDMVRMTLRGTESSNATVRTGIVLHESADGPSVSYRSSLGIQDTEMTLYLKDPELGEEQENTKVIRGIYRKESDTYMDPDPVSDLWLDAGACTFASLYRDAVQFEWRNRTTKAWEAMPDTYAEIIVTEFTLERQL